MKAFFASLIVLGLVSIATDVSSVFVPGPPECTHPACIN